MRYAVTMSFYINAESEDVAIYKARTMAARQDTKNDDGCSVDEVREAVFGQIERKVIYPKKKAETGISA
ncbi:MAG: hypothetical protein V4549_06470 [Bacteroidota bacterium]